MTTLTLTPNFTAKTLVSAGKVSVGEKVDVTVIGVTEAQTVNLRVRFRVDGVTVAVYPFAEGDVWDHSGSNATANMDLNTDLFRALYEGSDDRAKIMCLIVVDNPGDQNLYSSAQLQVGNWPSENGLELPYSLSTYQDDIAFLKATVAEIEQGIADTDQFILTHAHSGGTSQQIAHGNLLGIGTNSHAQIDAALLSVVQSLGTVSGEATGIRNDLDDIKAVCETAKAMPVSTAREREARVAFLIQGLIDSL